MLIGVVVVAALISAGIWFVITAEVRRESFARGELENARVVAQTGNLALAASDLSELADTYQGTMAAEEAVILLARIRLTESQPALALVELRKLIANGPSSQFRGPAYGLLGNALEQGGNFREAAAAYGNAANEAWYPFLTAEYLSDAGRTYALAGDTAQAVIAYERIVQEFGESDVAVEARVRLAELRHEGASS